MQFSSTQSKKYWFWAGALLLAVFFVWHAYTVNYVADDGYIAFQYVKNLLNGNGIVYNPGERVEGYNNFLWIILVAGLKLALPMFTIPQLAAGLGVFFGALTVLLLCRFSVMVHEKYSAFGLLAGAFMAVHSGFTAWSTAGLETPLFAFMILAGATVYISYLKTGKNFYLVPVVFVIAALTRTDGLLFFGLTFLHALVWNFRRVSLPTLVRRMAGWALIFAAIYGVYYLWRFTYYGYPLPNIFYAKVGGGIYQYLRGARYLWNYAKIYGVFVFIPAALVLLRRPRQSWMDYIAILAGVYSLYLIYAGGDGLAFYRFVAYIAPLIYLLVQEGFLYVYETMERIRGISKGWQMTAPALLVVLVSLVFTTRQTAVPLLLPQYGRWFDPQSQLFFPGAEQGNPYTWYDNYFVDRQELAAKWLEANGPQGALVASTPAGSIAYHMNLPVIDMLGLNDIHIAHTKVKNPGQGRAGHEKGDGKYVLSRAPEFILMGNVAVLPYPLDEKSMEKLLTLKSEHELWASPEFHQQYELVCVPLNDTGVLKYFSFYKKKDVQLSAFVSNPASGCEAYSNSVGG